MVEGTLNETDIVHEEHDRLIYFRSVRFAKSGLPSWMLKCKQKLHAFLVNYKTNLHNSDIVFSLSFYWLLFFSICMCSPDERTWALIQYSHAFIHTLGELARVSGRWIKRPKGDEGSHMAEGPYLERLDCSPWWAAKIRRGQQETHWPVTHRHAAAPRPQIFCSIFKQYRCWYYCCAKINLTYFYIFFSWIL